MEDNFIGGFLAFILLVLVIIAAELAGILVRMPPIQ